MIQRVQTLFLLCVIVCMVTMVMFPVWQKTDQAQGIKYTLDAFHWQEYKYDATSDSWQVTSDKPVYYLGGVAALVALVALYAIFQFKKRVLQIKLGALNAFLMMVLIGIATYFIYHGEQAIAEEARGQFMAGYFLPLGGMIFNSLANRFIKKDEDLIKSVDRIR